MCVLINPFKMIASNYTDAKIREYKGKKHYELSPHVFALVRKMRGRWMRCSSVVCAAGAAELLRAISV